MALSAVSDLLRLIRAAAWSMHRRHVAASFAVGRRSAQFRRSAPLHNRWSAGLQADEFQRYAYGDEFAINVTLW